MLILIAVLHTLAMPSPGDLLSPSEPESTLEAVGWLAGCWESRAGDRVTLEMWSAPAGGLMVGASRTVVAGRARAFEHLRLAGDDDGFVYTAIPSGQVETDFASTSVSAEGFVVENPDHDFPTRITYLRDGPDAFSVRVEGPDGAGGMDGFQSDYTRVSCTM